MMALVRLPGLGMKALLLPSGAQMRNVAPTVRSISTRDRQRIRQETLERFIRVDQAGEYGADRIYAGQLFVLGADRSTPDKRRTAELIEHMWNQEKEHLRTFNEMIPAHKVRPTALLPLWHVAGFVLGAGSALLGGSRGAMAVTVAVEAAITEHYDNQIRTLMTQDPDGHRDLVRLITRIRDEEQEHHDTGLEEEAEQWALYQPATFLVKAGCMAAIWLSERI